MVNTCAGTASVAKPAPPSGDTDCKKTENARNNEYNKMTNKNGQLTTNQKAVGPGTTMTGAQIKKGRGTKYKSGHSHKVAQQKNPNLAKGTTSKTSNMDCAGQPYNHSSASHSCHAEARVLDDFFKEVGKTSTVKASFVFNTLTKKASGKFQKIPCPNCHKMMCHAINTCKVEISICDNNNKKIDMKDHCNFSSDDERKAKYSALKIKLPLFP